MIITLLMVSGCVGKGFSREEMEITASVEIPAENKPNENIDINKVILGKNRSTVELKKQLNEINKQLEATLKDDAAKLIETDYLKKNIDKLSRPLPLQPYVPRILPTPGGVIIFTPYYYTHY
jgi:hypothetical protein